MLVIGCLNKKPFHFQLQVEVPVPHGHKNMHRLVHILQTTYDIDTGQSLHVFSAS